jgi:hypothetical protein
MNFHIRRNGWPCLTKPAPNVGRDRASVADYVVFCSLELHSLQRVFLQWSILSKRVSLRPTLVISIVLRAIVHHANPAAQLLNARYRPANHAHHLSPATVLAALLQPPPRIFDRKPGAVSLELLRRTEPYHLAKISVDGNSLFVGLRSTILSIAPLAAIPRERSFFDPAMNPRFLESFKRRRLGVSQPRFRAALGKSPAPAPAGPNQQEFDSTVVNPIANRGHLLALAQSAKLRQSNKPLRSSIPPGNEAHHIRVPDAPAPCQEHSVVPDRSSYPKCPYRHGASAVPRIEARRPLRRQNLPAYLHPTGWCRQYLAFIIRTLPPGESLGEHALPAL